MAKIVVIREIPFRVYKKSDGTWQGYCKLSKKHFHRGSRESLDVAMDEEAQRLKGDKLGQTLMNAADWQDYVAAKSLLAPLGATLCDAARVFVERSKTIKNPSTVESATNAFQNDKADLSPRYVAFMRPIFQRINDHCGSKMMHESGDVLVDWLRRSNLRGRGFNNLRGLLITFWRWCQVRGVIERNGITPFEQVSLKKESAGEITVLSPAMLKWLFKIANQEAYEWMVLSAFYGIRAAEGERLSGSDIHIEHDVIEIPAYKAKTGQRRLVKIIPEMKPWLTQLSERDRVLAFRPQRWIRKAISLEQDSKTRTLDTKPLLKEWHQNVLRHSWISYRLALTGNIDQVAADAGTSREKIYHHYRALRTLDGLPVTKELAEKWFTLPK